MSCVTTVDGVEASVSVAPSARPLMRAAPVRVRDSRAEAAALPAASNSALSLSGSMLPGLPASRRASSVTQALILLLVVSGAGVGVPRRGAHSTSYVVLSCLPRIAAALLPVAALGRSGDDCAFAAVLFPVPRGLLAGEAARMGLAAVACFGVGDAAAAAVLPLVFAEAAGVLLLAAFGLGEAVARLAAVAALVPVLAPMAAPVSALRAGAGERGAVATAALGEREEIAAPLLLAASPAVAVVVVVVVVCFLAAAVAAARARSRCRPLAIGSAVDTDERVEGVRPVDLAATTGAGAGAGSARTVVLVVVFVGLVVEG